MIEKFTFDRIRPYRKEVLPNGDLIMVYDERARMQAKGRRIFKDALQDHPDDYPEVTTRCPTQKP